MIEHRPARPNLNTPLPPLFPDESDASRIERSKYAEKIMESYRLFSEEFFSRILMEKCKDIFADVLETCWSKPPSLMAHKFPDFPSILELDLSLCDPWANQASFIQESFNNLRDQMDLKLVHIDCRVEDSFTAIISRILIQLGLRPEFGEWSREELRQNLGRFVLSLGEGYRLHGNVLETLLQYMRQLTSPQNRIVIILDSPISYSRLSAQTQFAIELEKVDFKMTSRSIFEYFLLFLVSKRFTACIISPEVLDFIEQKCSTSNLPFTFISNIIKFCVYRKVVRLPATSNFAATECKSIIEKQSGIETAEIFAHFNKLQSDCLLALTHNSIILDLLGVIAPERSQYHLAKEILQPGFGTRPFLDKVYSKLMASTPDEFVRMLTNLQKLVTAYSSDIPLAHHLKEFLMNALQSHAQSGFIQDVVNHLAKIISETEYFTTENAMKPFMMYDNLSELDTIFFADVTDSVQRTLKHPELYLSQSAHKPSSRAASPKKSKPQPDTVLLYQLSLEWQRMINLHDLYFQFQSQIHTTNRKPTVSQQKNYMARFMQAVNELEFIGVWTPVGGKRDTYERKNFCDGIIN